MGFKTIYVFTEVAAIFCKNFAFLPQFVTLRLEFPGGMFINFEKCARGHVYSRGYVYSVL